MPNGKSRRKGYIGEWSFRKLCKNSGFWTVWHNQEREKPDLTFLDDTTCEIKYSAVVPKKIYDWLKEKNPDILALKRVIRGESNEWIIVMKLKDYFKLRRLEKELKDLKKKNKFKEETKRPS